MDLEVASCSVGPLSRDYLTKLPHHVLPCMNLRRLFPVEENQDFIAEAFHKKIPWRSSVPMPITPLVNKTFEALNGIDLTTDLIRNKIKWQMKKEKLIKAVQKDKKNISESTKRRADAAEEDTVTQLPRGAVLLAEHLDKDPDPKFAGVYNWYYTGGTLATLEQNEENYLLYANQSKLSCSKYNENQQNSELMFTLALEENTPIYEVATTAVGAVVRQKSCVSLFVIGESDDKLSLSKIHSVSDERDTFLSVALRKKSNKKYCTLSSSGILKLWDTEYAKGYKMKLRVGPGEGVSVMDSWSSIQYMDSRTLLLADRCCVHLFDTRDMTEKQLAWCPRKLGELCEQLSFVSRSRLGEQVVYTTTTHHALTLDLRFGFCQRWSHMMSAPPYVGFTQVIDNDQECLCVGSQVMADCVVVVNSWKGGDPRAECRPMLLPSPSQGLLLARQQGLCLEPTLTQRFTQSMTGLTYLPSANGLHIVRQSSTGDVFIQQLAIGDDSEPPDQLTEKQLTVYAEWSRPAMLQQETTTVCVSDVKNFTPLLEALTDTYLAEEPVTVEVEGGGWRRSKQYLEDCVDLLAPRLLAVWEVEEEEEWLGPEEQTLVEQDPAEKVHNWLQADHTLTDMPSMKPQVASTPYVMPAMTLGSPARSEEEPFPWMTNPGQTVTHPPSTPNHKPTPNIPFSPPSLLSSDSDLPDRKRPRLLPHSDATPQKQPTSVASKPVSTAKKKFIPGF